MAGLDLVVGIDGGGTKTVAVLADATGVEVARSTGAGANLQTIGAMAVQERLTSLLGELVDRFGIVGTVRAVTASLAGVDRPADVPVATQAIDAAIEAVAASHPLVRWELARGSPTVTNDAVAALAAGAQALDGVVVIAGTGSIAFGVCAGARSRAGGWGSILGDEGSGHALGYHALRAVARAHDRRAPATALTGAILARLGAESAPDLIGIVSSPAWGVADTAALAPIVLAVAEGGDPVAEALVDEAAEELSLATMAVIRALPFNPTRDLPVVQSGGLWAASARLRSAFDARLCAGAPRARPTVSRAEPVSGAVWLALRDAGIAGTDDA